MSSAPLISLIVVTHNSAEWLRGFVQSWEKTLWAAPEVDKAGVEMIFADSGSKDDSVELAETLVPDGQIEVCGNVGYGAAVNQAARTALGEWLLVCNPDVTFDEGFARELLLPLVKEKREKPAWVAAACVAPKLMNKDGSLQPSVGRYPRVRGMVKDQFKPREKRKYVDPHPEEAGPMEWATGACLLIKQEAFLAVEGFDEKYFLYVEEVDLQKRLKETGHGLWFVPAAVVTHHAPNAGKVPREEVQRWAAKGTLRYFAKFGPVWSLWLYRVLAVGTRRLKVKDAFASRGRILGMRTGPV